MLTKENPPQSYRNLKCIWQFFFLFASSKRSFLLRFPAYSRTRYFVEQTKLPEVVKFLEASEESAFPLGKGLAGAAHEFSSTAIGTLSKILDGGSEYVVSAVTLPSETEKVTQRNLLSEKCISLKTSLSDGWKKKNKRDPWFMNFWKSMANSS